MLRESAAIPQDHSEKARHTLAADDVAKAKALIIS